MKEIKDKKDGKFKKILKTKIGVGIICLVIGAAATSNTSEIEKLEKEINHYEQSIESLSKESETHLSTIESKDSKIKELEEKIDSASPWFDMTEDEREVEKERILEAKAQKEEEERVAKEQKAEKEENERIAKEQAEEKKKKEEAAAIQSENTNNSVSNNDSGSSSNQGIAKTTSTQAPAENSAPVLITPTGKKYHKRACGRGNYSQTTLSEAKARGLSPCSKCY